LKISNLKKLSKKFLKSSYKNFNAKHPFLPPLLRSALLRNLEEVVAFKINFSNDFSIYVDPLRKGIYSNPSYIPKSYFTTYGRAETDLERILKEDVWAIMSFPFFGEIPLFTLQLMSSLSFGIESIEILGKEKLFKKVTFSLFFI